MRRQGWIGSLVFSSFVVASVLSLSLQSTIRAAELDRRQMAIVETVRNTIRRAATDYFEGKHESAGSGIRKAIDQINRAVGTGNPDLYAAMASPLDAVAKLHAMVELEGVSLPPFRRPKMPGEASSGKPTSDDPAGDSTLVSFTKQVAPILSSKCGSCHVNGRRGGFSLATYTALMQGPPEGVVVFAEDVIGSRLIETIETGDMPRGGGKVSPAELTTLKTWIAQGAKFDGDDPGASIASATPATAPAMTPAAKPMITRATGKETVSFVTDVAPLLIENCSGCHLDAMQTRGGLRLDTFVQMMRGGDTGAIITPGRGEASLLVQKLRGTAADGNRMPDGGRPPLKDSSIALISKWIDEGAAIDVQEDQPIRIAAELAWAATATDSELTSKRASTADRDIRLANSSATIQESSTDHFRVVGAVSQKTLNLVGKIAESQIKQAMTLVRTNKSGSAESFFRGRATIFVMPRRYDYSEFAKMVESRSVPSTWSAHWSFDGINAYLAMVASEDEDEETLKSRLLAPVVSLAVATRGTDVPRWFAQGLGTATALKQNATSRSAKEKLGATAREAAASVKDAKAFLQNRLTPEQSDSFGAALAMSMIDRNRRRLLDATIKSLGTGKPFDEAFTAGFGVVPEVYVDQFLKYAR